MRILQLIFFLVYLSVRGSLYAQTYKDSLEFSNSYYEALRCIAIENTDLAIQNLERCTEYLPNESSPYFMLANLYDQRKEPDKALERVQVALEKSPTNSWYVKYLSKMYLKVGNQKDAYALYENSIKENPEKAALRLDFAQILENNRDYISAAKQYEAYEKLNGTDTEYALKVVQLLSEGREPDQALMRLDVLLAKDSANLAYWINKAELLLDLNRGEEADAHFREMLALFPDVPEVRYTFAEFLLMTENYEPFIEQLRLVFLAKDLDAKPKIQLLKKAFPILSKRLQMAEFLALFNALLDAHPNSYEANFLAGNYYFEAKQFEKAVTHLQLARKNQPNNQKIWELELNALAASGRPKRLAEVADSAVMLYPNYPDFYFFKGYAKLQLKEYSSAVESLEIGKEFIIDDDNLVIEFDNLLAEAHYGNGNYTQAFGAYDEVLKQRPDNIMVMNNYSYYLAQQSTSLLKAKNMIEKALAIRPSSASFLDTYAWVLFKMKKYEQALVQIDAALANAKPTAVLLEHKGDILLALRRKPEALQAYQQAQELNPENKTIRTKINKLTK